MSPHLNASLTMMRPLDANLYVKVGKRYSLSSDPYPEYTSPSTSPQLAPPSFFDTVNSSTLEPCVPSPVESNITRTNSELCTNDSLMQHSLVRFAFPVPPDDGLGFFSRSASIDSCLSRNSLKTPASSPSNVPRNPHLEELIDEEASFGCVSDVYEDSWSISVSTPCYTNTPSRKSHCRTFSSEFFEESHSFSAAISSSTPAFNVPCEKVVPPKSPTVELMDDTLMSSGGSLGLLKDPCWLSPILPALNSAVCSSLPSDIGDDTSLVTPVRSLPTCSGYQDISHLSTTTSFPPPTVALPGEEAVPHDPLTMEPIGDTPVSFGGSPDFGDDSYRLSPVLPAHSEPRSRFSLDTIDSCSHFKPLPCPPTYSSSCHHSNPSSNSPRDAQFLPSASRYFSNWFKRSRSRSDEASQADLVSSATDFGFSGTSRFSSGSFQEPKARPLFRKSRVRILPRWIKHLYRH
jgi:hypothetical protein